LDERDTCRRSNLRRDQDDLQEDDGRQDDERTLCELHGSQCHINATITKITKITKGTNGRFLAVLLYPSYPSYPSCQAQWLVDGNLPQEIEIRQHLARAEDD
jgi:hypothetical protein